MELITTLLSGGQAPQAPVTQQGTDLISALLGSFAGDEVASARSSKSQKDEPVIDAEDLMRGGMAYMSAQQRGASGSEAIMDAIIAGSPLGESPQRAQSAKLIGGALLGAVTALRGFKKRKSASKSRPQKDSGRKASAQTGQTNREKIHRHQTKSTDPNFTIRGSRKCGNLFFPLPVLTLGDHSAKIISIE